MAGKGKKNNKRRRAAIQTGISNGVKTEVLDGIKAGQQDILR